MLHKLDGFIWLDAVSVDCYSNVLQHNGPGLSLPDTVAHIHSRAQKKTKQKTLSGTTCSQELGSSNSNEKNSQEAGTGLTNILFPPSQAKKNPTSGPFSPPLQWTRTHIYIQTHTEGP